LHTYRNIKGRNAQNDLDRESKERYRKKEDDPYIKGRKQYAHTAKCKDTKTAEKFLSNKWLNMSKQRHTRK
jgi:hypothetical protein